MLRAQPVVLTGSTSEGYDSGLRPTPCMTFQELLSILADGTGKNDGLHIDEGIHDTFAAMVAVTFAVKLGSLPLWMHVIGPASSGKTTLITALEGAYNLTYSVSKFTGMFSGFVAKKDPGMIPKVNGRCMLIKDLTPLLSSPEFVKIMGELRDIYDGRATAHYGNEMAYDYPNVNFGIISCVTEKIFDYQNNMSAVGERFLRICIDRRWNNDGTFAYFDDRRELQKAAAVRGMLSQITGTILPNDVVPATKRQKSSTWGLLNHTIDRIFNELDFIRKLAENFDPSGNLYRLCESLAEWVAISRSTVDRNRQNDISYRQNVENATRLTVQFTKLGIALCILFDKVLPDEVVLRIMRKIAFDTGFSFNLEILNRLAYKGQQNVDDLAQFLELSDTQVNRQLEDLMVFNAVSFEKLPNLTGNRGRAFHGYHLSPKLRTVADTLGLFEQESPLEPKKHTDLMAYLGIRNRQA